MKRADRKVIAERKRNLQRRLDRRNFKRAGKSIFAGGNVQYEMADRVRGFDCGGIGAMHTMVQGLGLDAALNDALLLLKIHAPYFESDHVLNMTYNILTGGECLEDLERLRENESYMDAIGAERIPDPTTAGDFCRRFHEESIVSFMEKDAARWIDRTIARLSRKFKRISLRGDTDYSLTYKFDERSEKVDVIFGYDAMPNVAAIAEGLPESAWERRIIDVCKVVAWASCTIQTTTIRLNNASRSYPYASCCRAFRLSNCRNDHVHNATRTRRPRQVYLDPGHACPPFADTHCLPTVSTRRQVESRSGNGARL